MVKTGTDTFQRCLTPSVVQSSFDPSSSVTPYELQGVIFMIQRKPLDSTFTGRRVQRPSKTLLLSTRLEDSEGQYPRYVTTPIQSTEPTTQTTSERFKGPTDLPVLLSVYEGFMESRDVLDLYSGHY